METFNGIHGVHVANCVDSVADAIRKCLGKHDSDIQREFTNRVSTAADKRMGMPQVAEDHLSLYKELLK